MAGQKIWASRVGRLVCLRKDRVAARYYATGGFSDRFINVFAAKEDFAVVIVTYSKPS